MTIGRITMQLDGVVEVSRMLEAAAVAWDGPFVEAGPAIDLVFEQIERQQISSEGAHGGERWKPLAASTQADRRRKGYGPAHPILVRSGRLARSLTSRSPDTISVHSPKLYVRGTWVPWYVFHQSRRPRKKIPRRPLVNFTADDRHALIRPVVNVLRARSSGHHVQAQDRLAGTFGVGPAV